MTAMTTATAPDDADTLANRRTSTEIDQLLLEMLKRAAEQNKHAAEPAKMKLESDWYPVIAMVTAAGIGAAITGLLIKLLT